MSTLRYALRAAWHLAWLFAARWIEVRVTDMDGETFLLYTLVGCVAALAARQEAA
jgi:hypothetical protein